MHKLDEVKIKQLWESGLSSASISKMFGVCSTTIGRRVCKLHCAPHKENPKKIHLDSNLIKDLYIQEQLGCPEIASKFNCSETVIKHKLKEANCVLRDNSEAHLAIYVRKKPYIRRSYDGEGNPAWKGGYIRSEKGYIRVYDYGVGKPKQHYRPEHDLVWEKVHNRKLPKGWCVHHLNGIKDDNRPENLVAMSRGKHAEIHNNEPYKKRIRQLEIENRQLRRALEDGQMILTVSEN